MVNNGKANYTKKTLAVRLLFFGNPSVADLAKDNGIKEVISIENDSYILFNILTVKGN